MGQFPFTSNKQHQFNPGDLDFRANPYTENIRLLGKDGAVRILRKGTLQDLFHQLVLMPWWKLLIVIVLAYVFIISFFAIVYYLLGPGNIHIPTDLMYENRFLHCYFFSAETLATVGYGYLYPITASTSFIASLEAFAGWISFAIIAGLVYGRFSMPKPGVIFSQHALISPYQNGLSLQCRLAGKYKGILMEVDARMQASWIEELPNGEKKRVYIQLQLEVPKVYMLSLSWTVIHKINEKSPLWGKTLEQLKAKHTEIMLMITGQNELYMQTIHAHTSFTADEIIWNARFKHTHEINEEGKTIFHLDRIDNHEKL